MQLTVHVEDVPKNKLYRQTKRIRMIAFALRELAKSIDQTRATQGHGIRVTQLLLTATNGIQVVLQVGRARQIVVVKPALTGGK